MVNLRPVTAISVRFGHLRADVVPLFRPSGTVEPRYLELAYFELPLISK